LKEKRKDEIYYEIEESLTEANEKLSEVVDFLIGTDVRLQEVGLREHSVAINENRRMIENLQDRIEFWKEEV